ncbi:MAG: hypothetical protein ABI356_10445 [Steroidobacteraceae bacterium]
MISKCCLLVLLTFGSLATAADASYGPELQGFDYPYPGGAF